MVRRRSDKDSPSVVVLKPLLHCAKPVVTFSLHASPVRLLAHVGGTDICFSADKDGGLEMWSIESGRRVSKESHPAQIGFEFKAETHLFDLQRVSSFCRGFLLSILSLSCMYVYTRKYACTYQVGMRACLEATIYINMRAHYFCAYILKYKLDVYI